MKMISPKRRLHLDRSILKFLILVILIPPVTGWIGDIFKDLITSGINDGTWTLSAGDFWLLIFAFIIAVVLVTWAYRFGKTLIAARIVAQHEGDAVPAHPVLICLLSKQQPPEPRDGGWWMGDQQLPHGLDAVCDRKLEVRGFSWQQNLRAARHHAKSGTLKNLIVIGSGGNQGSGSKASLEAAQAFFGHYLPGVQVLTPGLEKPQPYSPDFEDLEQTRRALKAAITLAKAPDQDIIIDVTGGQKTASIAATLVTLDRADLMFQYVGTGPQAGTIYGFNTVTETSQA